MSVYVIVKKNNAGNELVFTVADEHVKEVHQLLERLGQLAQEKIETRMVAN